MIQSDSSLHQTTDDEDSTYYCTVCFGLTSPVFQTRKVLPEIRRSLIPYCSNSEDTNAQLLSSYNDAQSTLTMVDSTDGNYLSKESPTIHIPLLIQVRAHCCIAAAKIFLLQSQTTDTASSNSNISNKNNSVSILRTASAEEIYLAVKGQIKTLLKEICIPLVKLSEQHDVLPQQFHDEESGYLTVHTMAMPPKLTTTTFNNTQDCIPPSLQLYITKHKHKILSTNHKMLHPRTRFRGNDPTLKQGGDPRKNLELRLRHETIGCAAGVAGDVSNRKTKRRRIDSIATNKKSSEDDAIPFHDWNTIISWLDKDTVHQWSKEDECSAECAEWLQKVHASRMKQSTPSNELCCSIYATAWRRPFCIHGYYTKILRDISQTPFYVNATSPPEGDSNSISAIVTIAAEFTQSKPNDGMIRKGISSVEEMICPQISSIGCKGISMTNNNPHSSIVYGMCKFHASGREDMDVRMLLPHPSVMESSNVVITGRPFVCELIDAHRVPSLKNLREIENAINGTVSTKDTTTQQIRDEIKWDEHGWPHSLVSANRSYGNDGVGVSSLQFVPSNVFSTLQSETENKVKHYGCICYSEIPLESDAILCQKLECSPWEPNGSESNDNTTYPLKIEQSTPLRVLHRRSSDVRIRYILTLSARCIDKHWFQIRMSTSAGTYVKEFVHGDCGRTYPSVRSLLGGRVDITELDCEGIVVS